MPDAIKLAVQLAERARVKAFDAAAECDVLSDLLHEGPAETRTATANALLAAEFRALRLSGEAQEARETVNRVRYDSDAVAREELEAIYRFLDGEGEIVKSGDILAAARSAREAYEAEHPAAHLRSTPSKYEIDKLRAKLEQEPTQ